MRRPMAGVAAALTLSSPLAFAHGVGLSTAAVRAADREVAVEMAFARADLAAALPELAGGLPDLGDGGPTLGTVTGDGVSCPELARETRALDDGLQVRVRFRCPHPPAAMSYGLALLPDLPHGHRHMVTFSSGAGEQRAVLHRGDPVATVALAASSGAGRAFGRLVVLGAEHILGGLDHLVFLLGLLLVGPRPRALLRTVTAFTAGHSITLACGALGIWSPGPRWIEPLIALSIAYVGVENLLGRDPERRWRIALGFGLVHGFGFSGALAELALPRAQIVPALLAFNLGVEIGQLAVLAAVVPLFGLARRRWPVVPRYLAPALSGAIILPGLVWFVLRLGL
jgi:hypothetical protein